MSKFLTLEGAPTSRPLSLAAMLGEDDSLGWRIRRPSFRGITRAISRAFSPKAITAFATGGMSLYFDAAKGLWKHKGTDAEATPAEVQQFQAQEKAGGSGSGIFDSYGIKTKKSDFSVMPGITNPETNAVVAALQMGEDLAGFSFRRALTPPRRIRRMAKPPMVVRKGLRYAGAAALTTTVPFGAFAGKQRNKIFGLKGGEQRTFDTAAKVTRSLQIAAVTIAGGAAVAPALGFGSAGALNAAAATASGAVPSGTGVLMTAAAPESILSVGTGASSVAASFPGVAAAGTGVGSGGLLSSLGAGLMKGSSFLMKKAGSDAVWSIAKGMGQDWVASKFDKRQVSAEDYAALPNNTLIPTGQTQGNGGMVTASSGPGGGWGGSGSDEGIPDPGMAPTVAGSGSMAPGGDSYESQRYGDQSLIVTPESREANSAVNPLGWKADLLSPEPTPAEEAQADRDFTDMVKGQGESQLVAAIDNPASEPAPVPASDSVQAILEPDPTLEADDFDMALGVVRELGRIRVPRRKSARPSPRVKAFTSHTKPRRQPGMSDALWGVISC